MTITAAESFDLHLVRHCMGIQVLLLRAGPIHDFDGVDILQHFQCFCARHWIIDIYKRGFMNELKTWIEFVTEWMIRNEKTADIVDNATKFFYFVNTANVLIKAKSAN